jgi:hypothetical protein
LSPLDNPRRRRQIEAIHRLGPRVVGELLVEVADLADLDQQLTRYASLDGNAVRALGADRFPPNPLTKVG